MGTTRRAGVRIRRRAMAPTTTTAPRSFTSSAGRVAKNDVGWSHIATKPPVRTSLPKPSRQTRPSCIRTSTGVTMGSPSSTRRSIMGNTNGRAMTMATPCGKSTATVVKGLALACAPSYGRSVASIRRICNTMSQPTRRSSMLNASHQP
jgi:hypothetical protein